VATPLVVRYTAYDTKVYIYPIMMTKIWNSYCDTKYEHISIPW
jgi:hypothetical protein